MVTIGQAKQAERRAFNIFDEWNDSVGLVNKKTSYYYEILSVIRDAVHCGLQEATGDKKPLFEGEKVI